MELLSFSAEALSDRIHLDWATATEHNNAGFSVERSADATDFVPIGWIAGEGSSLSEQHYTYDDRDLVPGCLYYYRLRQTDLDGHSTFSGVVYASLPGQVFIATWLGNGQLALTSPDSGMLSIRVYDLTGRLREVLRMPVASGTTLLEPQATWGEVAGPGLLELDMGGHHTVVPAFP